MKCSLEQIVSITRGAVRVEAMEDGIHFFRFTEEQQNVYAGTSLYRKTLATAGIILAFGTDSRRMTLSVTAAVGTNRLAFTHDILKNGRLIGQLGNQDRVEMKRVPMEDGPADSPGAFLGAFTGTYDLGEGEKEIRIVFPWSAVSVLQSLELDDGASLIPAARSGRTIVFYGDSITQGYDAKYPSRHHTVRLAEFLGAEGFNKAIGADRFCPALAACGDPVEPDDILAAYGTNDWSKSGWEEFQRDSLMFYRLLSERHPKARIWALTPVWRGDCGEEMKMGPFARMENWLGEAASRFSNVTVIRGRDLVPHESGYFSDKRLHPNDGGFHVYYEKLRRELMKAGIGGPFPADGSCGENVRWSFDGDTGILRICGQGPMDDWPEDYEDAPWDAYREQIVSLDISAGVTRVGDRAFHHLPELVRAALPEGLEVIGVNAFQGCGALEKIIVPDGVRILASKAFQECADLKEIRLPATLQNIDMKAFCGDTQLKRVVYEGTALQWGQVRISRQARGNDPLAAAALECRNEEADPAAAAGMRRAEESDTAEMRRAEGTAAAGMRRPEDRYETLTGRIRRILAAGGDGNMYILDPKKFENAEKNITKCGECTVIVFPKGTTMMIDGGNLHCADQTLRLVKSIGLKKLDYFVLSHPHGDHVNGAVKIAEYLYGNGGEISRYYTVPFSMGAEPGLREMLRLHGTEIHADVQVPYAFPEIDGVTVDICNPTAEMIAVCEELAAGGSIPDDGPVNNLSVSMKFRFGQSTYLTAGDLYRSRERTLARELGPRLQADVMKTNHHGTYTSSCREWLDAVDPMIAFSEADDNGSQILAEECRKRGIAYYSEGSDGLILITLDGTRKYKAETQYDSPLRDAICHGQTFGYTESMNALI